MAPKKLSPSGFCGPAHERNWNRVAGHRAALVVEIRRKARYVHCPDCPGGPNLDLTKDVEQGLRARGSFILHDAERLFAEGKDEQANDLCARAIALYQIADALGGG